MSTLTRVRARMTPDVRADDEVAAWAPSRVRRPEALAVLVSTAGLLIQSAGYAQGWGDHSTTALFLWYVGFAVLVCPFAWLLLAPSRTGHQRLAASLAFGLLMYASWLLSNPIMSTRFDETLHVTTLVDLIDRHRFFQQNTLLPVSPHYPGLELATAGVHWLTGLPFIVCQILVVVVARSTFVLSLFLLASRIGRSTRVGGATVLLYGGSSQFYFFNSQFAYQTVAIALLMAALYLLVRAFDSAEERPWKELLAAQVCLGGLAVTHHLTSWLMLGLLWVLALAFRFGHEQRRFRLTLVTAEIATIVVAAWTAVIAPLLISYLGPVFDLASNQLVAALDGTGTREVGTGASGQAAPTWELMVMAASILMWCLLLLPSLWRGWRHGTLGPTRARYVPLLVAAIYPFLQVGRLSLSAAEVTDRMSTFVMMAIALVVGAWLATRVHAYGLLVLPAVLVLILGGTLLGGGPDWQRVPGPYLAGAEQRSVDSETVAVAQWAGTYLPDDSRVAADITFTRVLPNYAPVIPLTAPAGYASMTPIFIEQSVDQVVLSLILQQKVDFIFVDTRLVGQTALSGSFFDGGTGYGASASTVTPDQVTKFDNVPGIHLILNGPVKVYDVRGLRHVARTFPPPRDPPGIPGSWTPWQILVTLLLALVGLVLRGRLLDPRRFRARDIWRPAIVIPVTMVLGAAGVVAGFSPVAGAVAVAVVLYVLVAASDRPPPLPAGPGGAWPWGLAIGLVGALAVAIAVVSAWHGLLDHAALPAPPNPSSVVSGGGGS